MVDGATKKTKGDWISWKNRPYDSSRSDETHRRAELWAAFTDFVREHRGWITSPPGSRTATLETEIGSTLADRLRELGYSVAFVCQETRVTGAQLSPQAEILRWKGHAIDFPAGITQVDRYEVTLPWGAPAPPMKKRPA
jgi:hypothetical protein